MSNTTKPYIFEIHGAKKGDTNTCRSNIIQNIVKLLRHDLSFAEHDPDVNLMYEFLKLHINGEINFMTWDYDGISNFKVTTASPKETQGYLIRLNFILGSLGFSTSVNTLTI